MFYPKKKRWGVVGKVVIFLLSLMAVTAFAVFNVSKKSDGFNFGMNRSILRHAFNATLITEGEWPREIRHDGDTYRLEYTFNMKLEEDIKRRLKSYGSDFSTVVVLDNKTGAVLAAVGYDGERERYIKSSLFKASHPAASIFKIVTAATLLDQSHFSPQKRFSFTGRSTTLYKSQLIERAAPRFAKDVSLEEAFAKSNNPVFGKAAIANLTGVQILEMAKKLGFSQNLMEEIELEPSTLMIPSDQYNLAELASGFNIDTRVSPLHAALLPLIIANNGTIVYPHIIKKITDEEDDELFLNEKKQLKILESEITSDLASMMEAVVLEGTARKSFRTFDRNKRLDLVIGGKTGSMTGGVPYGKRDWFVAYAKRRGSNHPGISIAVMNVNVKKWHVKSTFLAREIIEHYYKNF